MKTTPSFSLKHLLSLLVLSAGLVLTLILPFNRADAQSGETLQLSLRRDFGYSNFGGTQVQGSFTVSASGPSNLARVVFLLDGQSMGEDKEAPFKLSFSTDSYPHGTHTFSATGFLSDGQEIGSNQIRTEFVSADVGTREGAKIIIPVAILIIVALLASTLGPALIGRGKRQNLPMGAQREYGASGGTICPKCHRPFALHFFSMNLLMHKLERCPYCGSFVFVRRLPVEVLRKAEADELKDAQAGQKIPEESEEEKLRKELDDSKYQ